MVLLVAGISKQGYRGSLGVLPSELVVASRALPCTTTGPLFVRTTASLNTVSVALPIDAHFFTDMKKKEWRAAIRDCTRVLSEEPQNIKALMRRAKALVEWGKPTEALANVELLLQLEPNDRAALQLERDVRAAVAARSDVHLPGGRRVFIQESDSEESDEEEAGHVDAMEDAAKTEEFSDASLKMAVGQNCAEVTSQSDAPINTTVNSDANCLKETTLGAFVKPTLEELYLEKKTARQCSF